MVQRLSQFELRLARPGVVAAHLALQRHQAGRQAHARGPQRQQAQPVGKPLRRRGQGQEGAPQGRHGRGGHAGRGPQRQQLRPPERRPGGQRREAPGRQRPRGSAGEQAGARPGQRPGEDRERRAGLAGHLGQEGSEDARRADGGQRQPLGLRQLPAPQGQRPDRGGHDDRPGQVPAHRKATVTARGRAGAQTSVEAGQRSSLGYLCAGHPASLAFPHGPCKGARLPGDLGLVERLWTERKS